MKALITVLLLLELLEGLTSSFNDLLPAAFPFKDGYIGGDDVYSIQLGEGRFVWLYGDTFWNHQAWNKTREYSSYGMPSNTVGITSISSSGKEVSFQYYRGNGVKPFGMFNYAPDEMTGLSAAQREALRIWPKDGQMVNGKLWVSLLLIVESKNMFDSLGIDYALVRNPQENPNKWQIDYLQTLRSRKIFPATAMHTHTDGHLYSLTTIILDELSTIQRFVILRYPNAAIGEAPQYLAQDGAWKGLPVDKDTLIVVDECAVIKDMAVLSPHGNTEASLHFDERSAAWVIISGQGTFLDPVIALMASKKIEGPWSEPLTLVDGYPENDLESDEYIKGAFCYAGKGHPLISKEYYVDAMPITYACNSFDMQQLLDDNRIYQPKTIVIEGWDSKVKEALSSV